MSTLKLSENLKRCTEISLGSYVDLDLLTKTCKLFLINEQNIREYSDMLIVCNKYPPFSRAAKHLKVALLCSIC